MTKEKQQENHMISATRSANIMDFMIAAKPTEQLLFSAITKYMLHLKTYVSTDKMLKKHCPAPSDIKDNYLDKEDARWHKNMNIIMLTPEFIFSTGVIDPSKLSKKQANYRARQVAKALVTKGILQKTQIKDQYMINPLYIYSGATFGDCYIEYCNRLGKELYPNDPYLHEVYYTYVNNKKTCRKNPLERDKTIEEEIESTYDEFYKRMGIDPTTQKPPTSAAPSYPTYQPYKESTVIYEELDEVSKRRIAVAEQEQSIKQPYLLNHV